MIQTGKNKDLTEVYKNDYGAVYQSNSKNLFWIEFSTYSSWFNLPCFFMFKRKVESIDLEKMAMDVSKASDAEIISPCGCDRCFVLTLPEIYQLRELLDGAKVMLELNSIINEKLDISLA